MTAPAPAPDSVRPSARQRVRALLTENLGLKAIALLLSIFLWLALGLRTPTEGYRTVRVGREEGR